MKNYNDKYTDESVELLSSRFKLLGEPTRVRLLLELAEGEKCVKDLVEIIGTGQANISKHLSLLTQNGLVNRRKEGLHVFYSIVNFSIFDIVELAHKDITKGIKQYHDALT